MSEKEKAETSQSVAVTVSDTSSKATTSSSSTAGQKEGGGDEQAGWNLGVFEDKNPFSGFSEEHMNKLDEFLSSEEARKILQQTSEGDFTPSMAELDSGQESTNTSTDDLLPLDMFESKEKAADLATVSGYGDHAYALPSNHAPKSSAAVVTTSPSPGSNSSPVVVSPRKSNRIAIRKEREADGKEALAVPLLDLTAIKKDEEENAVNVTEDVGTSTSDMESTDNSKDMEEETQPKGRGRGRPRRSAVSTEPSPLSIRRSTRIGDIEQREMAEKIRQENLQKEKEALEALKKKEVEEEDKPPAKKRGRPPKAAKDEEEDDKEEESSDEEEDTEEKEEEEEEEETPTPTKKGKGKGKKGATKKKVTKKKEESEDESDEEEEEEKPKKGKKKQTVKSKATPKGKKGKKATAAESKDAEESESEEDDEEEEEEEEEEEKEATTKVKKGGKKKVGAKAKMAGKRGKKRKAKDESEEETPKKKKKMIAKGKKKKDESESEEEEEITPSKKVKGKKGKVLKGKKKKGKASKDESEEEDESPKAGKKKGKGKKGLKRKGKKKGKKAAEESEEESEEETPKKGKKKGKKTAKDESDEESDDDTPKKGKKKGKKAKDKDEEESEDETPKKGKKKGQKAKEDSDSTPKKGRKKGKQDNNKEESEAEMEEETPKKGKKVKKGNTDETEMKQKTEVKQKAEKGNVDGSPKSLKGKVVKKTDISPKNEQEGGQNVTRKGRLGMKKTGEDTPPSRVMKRGKVGNTVDCEPQTDSPKKRKVVKKEESESSAEDGKKALSDQSEKSKDNKSVKQRHSSGSHRIRHDSIDSKKSDDSQVERKTNSFGEMTPKPVRRKSRKSEEIIVDPSVMDLFKPDGIVLHDKEDTEDKPSADQVKGHARRSSEDKVKVEVKSEKGVISVETSVDSKEKLTSDVKLLSSDVKLKMDEQENKTESMATVGKVEVKGEGHEVKSEDEFKKPLPNLTLDSDSLKDVKNVDTQEIKTDKEDSSGFVKSDDNKMEVKSEQQSVSINNNNSLQETNSAAVSDVQISEDSAKVKQIDDKEVVLSEVVKVQGQNTETSEVKVENKTESEKVGVKCEEIISIKDEKPSTETKKTEEVIEKKKVDLEENQEKLDNKKLETKDRDSRKSSKDRKKRSPSEKAAIKSRRKSSHDKGGEENRSKETEGKRKRVKKSLGADMQEHEESEEDTGDLSYEDDEADSDYEPPDMVYCICKQPHGNRFMICCDKCEDWFHGNCVGITRAQGKKMEQNKEEYICPVCKGEKGNVKTPKKVPESETRKSSLSKDTKVKGHDAKQEVKDDHRSSINKADKDHKKEKSSDRGDKSHSSSKSSHHHHHHHRSDHHRHRSTSSDGKKEHDKHRSESRSSKSDHRGDQSGHSSKEHRKSLDSKTSKEDHKKGLSSERSPNSQPHKVTPSKDTTSSKKPETQKATPTSQKDDKQTSSVPTQKAGSVEHRRKSSVGDSERLKSKEKRTPQPCVVCKKEGLLGTVYCGDECLTKHVEDSLRNIHQQQEKQGSKNVKKPGERKIVVLEKKSGRILTGPNAPTEIGIKEWLQQHPTFEILCPTAKPSSFYGSKDKEKQAQKEREKSLSEKDKVKEKQGESKEVGKTKEEGPDPVRINVRKSLRDALTYRASKADDVMLSNSEIKSLALSIEEELFRCFKETNHKYKAKYRSLIFNIKDSKNQGLFRKILAGNIKPHKLVKMTPEELASKELARWREYETKHNLEMIELTEKEHMKEHQQIVKKTHKGEVTLEEEDLSTLESRGSEPAKPTPAVLSPDENKTDILSDLIIDTTSQHKMHLFDLNCRICTGKMAPPQEEPPPSKKVKVVKSVSAEEKTKSADTKVDTKKKTEEEQKKAEEVVKEVLKAIQKAKSQETPVVDSTVTVGSPDSALQSGLEKKPKFTPSGPQLWKGFIFMQDVAKFVTTSYRVSGPVDKLDLPDTIHVCGRIAPEQVWDYLSKMKKIGTRDICILRFIPGNDEEKTSYINLYSYLNSRARCGVVGNCAKYIKDFYILPLASHSKIPSILKPFDGPGLEENRPHMLLAVIVKQKQKRHSSSSADSKHPYDPSDSKKSRPVHDKEGHRHHSSGSSSFTPPTATPDKQTYSPSVIASSSKGTGSSKLQPLTTNKDHRATPTSKQTTPSSLQTTPSTTPSSSGATPAESAGRHLAGQGGSKDPIVAFYGSGEVLPVEEEAVDDTPYSPGAQETETDDPYDPENAEFDNTKAKQPQKTSVAQMIEKMAKTNNPAEMTAIMVTSLATASTLKDKQMLLLELTQKVKEQKDLLEAKRLERPASFSTPTPAFAMNTLSSAISAITAVSKQLSMASKKAGVSQSPGKEASVDKAGLPSATVASSSAVKTADSVVSSSNQNEKSTKIVAVGEKKSEQKKGVAVTKETSEQQPPAVVPEALQSLFCSIPGNYSHITNVSQQVDAEVEPSDESETKNNNDTPDVDKQSAIDAVSSKDSSLSQKRQQESASVKKPDGKMDSKSEKKEKGFNVKLLAFDYGDSDSESGEEEKTPDRENNQEEVVLIPGIEVEHKKPDIKPLPRMGVVIPPPQPLPLEPLPLPVAEERIQPPLPPEPPPPPPDHAPDDEEEESLGKKGKGKGKAPKPPPEIVLQPTDPVGKVILEMSFHKIQQEMTVPAPPLPPLPGIGLPPVMSGPPSMPISQAPMSTTPMRAPPMLPPQMAGAPVNSRMPMDGSVGRGTIGPPNMPHNMSPMGPGPSMLQGDVMSPSIRGPRMSMGPPPPGRGRPGGPGPGPQHHMSPDGPGFGRGKKKKKKNKSGIPSLFDVKPNPSRKAFNVNWQEDPEEEEWSLDQDLRQQAAEDQDFRTQIMDRDERIQPLSSGVGSWDGGREEKPAFSISESAQDVDHRQRTGLGPFKGTKLSGGPSKVPIPQALEDNQSSLPPLPLPSEILIEDSDMRKFPPGAAEDCDYRIGNPASASSSATSTVAPPVLEDVDLRHTNFPPDKANTEPVHKKAKLDSVKEDIDQRSPKPDFKIDQSKSSPSTLTPPLSTVTSQTSSSNHPKVTSQPPVLGTPTSGHCPPPPGLLDSGSRLHGPPPPSMIAPHHMRMPGAPPSIARPLHPPRPPKRNQPAPPGVDDWE